MAAWHRFDPDARRLTLTVHVQPNTVVTTTEFVAASEPCAALFVAREKSQPAPDCVTTKSLSAILNAPNRPIAVGFGSTL